MELIYFLGKMSKRSTNLAFISVVAVAALANVPFRQPSCRFVVGLAGLAAVWIGARTLRGVWDRNWTKMILLGNADPAESVGKNCQDNWQVCVYFAAMRCWRGPVVW